MTTTFRVATPRQGAVDITDHIRETVRQTQVLDGLAVVLCKHTTAGITINENADADVIHDMLLSLESAFSEREDFRHFEGNSTAHMKAALIGSNVTVIIEDGALVLGMWQGIYLFEFDGPRDREVCVKIISG